jgi:flagellar basal body rod protein FlgC
MNISSLGLNGLKRVQGQIERVAGRVAKAPLEPQDVVELLNAKNSYSANLKLIQTDDEMQKQSIDLLG